MVVWALILCLASARPLDYARRRSRPRGAKLGDGASPPHVNVEAGAFASGRSVPSTEGRVLAILPQVHFALRGGALVVAGPEAAEDDAASRAERAERAERAAEESAYLMRQLSLRQQRLKVLSGALEEAGFPVSDHRTAWV